MLCQLNPGDRWGGGKVTTRLAQQNSLPPIREPVLQTKVDGIQELQRGRQGREATENVGDSLQHRTLPIKKRSVYLVLSAFSFNQTLSEQGYTFTNFYFVFTHLPTLS